MVLENQSYVDYGMVLRVMEAEIIGYEKQRREAYVVNRTNNTKFDKHEYLSRMKKEQKFVPIITLVLYVGKDKIWDGERSLHKSLDRMTVDTVSGILKLNINWSLFTRQDDEGREVFDVCKAFEDYKEEGKQEMAIEMIRNLMKSQKVSFEIAANMLGLSKSSQKKIKTLI